MKKLKKFIFFWFLTVGMIAQNQLPLANGSFEATQNGNFDYWINIANEGAEATYSIETEDLIEGSSKALKSEIHTLGPNGWHVSSKSCLLYTSPSPRDRG